MGSISHVIKIQDVIRSGAAMYSHDFPKCHYFPKWLVELCENHKSSWIPDSKGGEPNCRRE